MVRGSINKGTWIGDNASASGVMVITGSRIVIREMAEMASRNGCHDSITTIVFPFPSSIRQYYYLS